MSDMTSLFRTSPHSSPITPTSHVEFLFLGEEADLKGGRAQAERKDRDSADGIGKVSSELIPAGEDQDLDKVIQQALRNLAFGRNARELEVFPLRDIKTIRASLSHVAEETAASKTQKTKYWSINVFSGTITAMSTAAGPLVAGGVALTTTIANAFAGQAYDKINDSFAMTIKDERLKVIYDLQFQYKQLGDNHIISYLASKHGTRGKLFPDKVAVCHDNLKNIIALANAILRNIPTIKDAIRSHITDITEDEATLIVEPLKASAEAILKKEKLDQFRRGFSAKVKRELDVGHDLNKLQTGEILNWSSFKEQIREQASKNAKLKSYLDEIEANEKEMKGIIDGPNTSEKVQHLFLRARNKYFFHKEEDVTQREALNQRLHGLDERMQANIAKAEALERSIQEQTKAAATTKGELTERMAALRLESTTVLSEIQTTRKLIDAAKLELHTETERAKQELTSELDRTKEDLLTTRRDSERALTMQSAVIAELYEQIRLQNHAISRLQYADVVNVRQLKKNHRPHERVDHPPLTREYTPMTAYHFPHGTDRRFSFDEMARPAKRKDEHDTKHSVAAAPARAAKPPKAKPPRPATAAAAKPEKPKKITFCNATNAFPLRKRDGDKKPIFVAYQMKGLHQMTHKPLPKPSPKEAQHRGILPNRGE